MNIRRIWQFTLGGARPGNPLEITPREKRERS